MPISFDSTGLKVFGEGEWKVKKHGQEKRRVWRKLHLAVDAVTHEVICADLSLNNVTDAEAFPGLIRQTHRKIKVKQLFGGHLTLHDYDAQVGEAMAMIRALNKMTHACMPKSVRVA